MTFRSLGIIDPILKALDAKGYTKPTPVQEQSIPILLNGNDLLGCAQTGTGKTAAFAIPIIQQLHLNKHQDTKGKRKVRALIITPTRELAIQIGENFTTYAKHTGIQNAVIFGGVKQHSQVKRLRAGVDVLVATPGRLLDLINQGFISLKDVEYSVLDEADHMLDMGFIHDIKRIIAKLPNKRQSLFFSATMPPEIIKLSGKILGNPEKVTIAPEKTTAEKVEQSIYFVPKKSKIKLLIHLIKENNVDTAIAFSRTKHGANKIVKLLLKAGISSAAIHGNKSQGARQLALSNFKKGTLKVLVATDIAARGIDVSELEYVFNYDLPNIPETYVHRIGRTGRANASGTAISFCDIEERAYLKDIEKLIGEKITIVTEHPFVNENEEIRSVSKKKQTNKSQKSFNRARRNDNPTKKRENPYYRKKRIAREKNRKAE